mmetsp:Transcript_39474/g.97462  ORF Transcript_39474/g.97462 Transcript_39474/m.97462 type:complete len:278 (-) Transcript_39474:94-927(-)
MPVRKVCPAHIEVLRQRHPGGCSRAPTAHHVVERLCRGEGSARDCGVPRECVCPFEQVAARGDAPSFQAGVGVFSHVEGGWCGLGLCARELSRLDHVLGVGFGQVCERGASGGPRRVRPKSTASPQAQLDACLLEGCRRFTQLGREQEGGFVRSKVDHSGLGLACELDQRALGAALLEDDVPPVVALEVAVEADEGRVQAAEDGFRQVAVHGVVQHEDGDGPRAARRGSEEPGVVVHAQVRAARVPHEVCLLLGAPHEPQDGGVRATGTRLQWIRRE